MKIPEWQKIPLESGIQREPIPDASRLVIWLPGAAEGVYRCWERIGNVPNSEIDRERGICALPATSIRARQKVQGLMGKILDSLRKNTNGPTWILPNGESAQQAGDRQSDLSLVWAEDETVPADEARIKVLWPECTRLQKIGANLFLVGGIGQTEPPKVAPVFTGTARDQAEQLLDHARHAGDARLEGTALVDLGIAFLRSGETPRAVVTLEQALEVAHRLENRLLETDALGNLGLALLEMGQFGRALEVIDQQLTFARAAGDQYEEKIAQHNLGLAYSRLGDHASSLAAYQQALALARQVADEEHEADMSWFVAIEHAELGQRDQAIHLAQAAIALFEKVRHPQVGLLKENLQKYLASPAATLEGTDSGTFHDHGDQGKPPVAYAPGSPQSNGPSMMRMAIGVVKSVAKFFESGFKTVPQPLYQKRLQKCATCKHHTGMRCKLCGCFTTVKAWLPHEHCPIGKWPD